MLSNAGAWQTPNHARALQPLSGGTYSAPCYVAVNPDPAPPDDPGNSLPAPDAGRPDAAAEERRSRSGIRIGHDRKYFRRANHFRVNQGDGVPGGNSFCHHPLADHPDRPPEYRPAGRLARGRSASGQARCKSGCTGSGGIGVTFSGRFTCGCPFPRLGCLPCRRDVTGNGGSFTHRSGFGCRRRRQSRA